MRWQFFELIQQLIAFVFPLQNYKYLKELRKAEVNNELKTKNKIQYLALFNYKNKYVKNNIKTLKNKGVQEVVDFFAGVLYDLLLDYIQNKAILQKNITVWLIPLPLHPTKYKERGFNQNLLITKILSDRLAELTNTLHAEKILKRIKKTKDQKGLNKKERLLNVKGAFSAKLPKNASTDDLYIIIDDIITTGATMQEAQKTLRKAGAKNILLISLADA